MEHTENIKNKPICQCRNSIKLSTLEYVNSLDKPIDIHKLINLQFDKTKEENKNIEIDDDFLKTYIRSIISEMVDSRFINLHKIDKSELDINNTFFYVKMDLEKLNEKLQEMTDKLNSSVVKPLSEINPGTKNNSCVDLKTKSAEQNKNKSEGSSLNNSLIVEKESNKINIIQEKQNSKELLIDEFILLKNKLEKLKKENKTKKLHNEIHKFNEMKDIGQELLGYIAGHKGKRIKEYYEDLGISDDDTK
jgi:hypothetical protein